MKSTILSKQELNSLSMDIRHVRCGKCENACFLTINKMNDGSIFITGNRCEKGASLEKTPAENDDGIEELHLPINLYKKKYDLIFGYEPLPKEEATRGEIGIPRVLNIYENYPFWFTLFTALKYRVIISQKTTKKTYELGLTSISSDTLCYPAKVVNGAIVSLLEEGVKTIFYPAINFEINEHKKSDNHFNCPVVATMPETIKTNMMNVFDKHGAKLISDFLTYDKPDVLAKQLHGILGIPLREVKNAVTLASSEDKRVKDKIRELGKQSVELIKKNGARGVVLAGRPYHLDSEINHGIDTLLISLGFSVLSEDSVAHLSEDNLNLRILDQWMYHSRLYKAADFVSRNPNLELIQLNSFGCGPDAIVADQVKEILRLNNKLFTLIKIDEGSGLGAIKIRLRSLKSVLELGYAPKLNDDLKTFDFKRKKFSKEMKESHTLIIPQMSPFHFNLLERSISNLGYNVILLPEVDENAIEEGIKYVNNDACYPTIITLGQIFSFIKSGELDIDKTAIFMSQTGGGCRASNYIALLRKALHDMGLPEIPVISVSLAGLEHNPGFKINYKFLKGALFALILGDVFMHLVHRIRPHEVNKGETNKVYERELSIVLDKLDGMTIRTFKKEIKRIINVFDNIETNVTDKPKVGVVGEILVKYHPTANNDVVGLIESEGGEAVVPGIVDFFLYGMINKIHNKKELGGSIVSSIVSEIGIFLIEWLRSFSKKPLDNSKHFHSPLHIKKVAKKASKILSLGNQCGEGWLLTGEMIELIDSGVSNIICLQPFACLPNHITGKGMLKALREYNKNANIVPIDYDPGASIVNQINRIKLMLSHAK